MSRWTRGRLSSADSLVILVCAGLATGLSLFFRGYGLRLAVPVMFLLVVIAVAQLCNRLATTLIATAACLIFALVLFEPYGSLAVRDAGDRLALTGFALAALGAVCLSPRPVRQPVAQRSFRK
jgi:K+-sensing histidine kinase KdpD